MSGAVKNLKSKEELAVVLGGGAPVILHFWAKWCEASKQMDQVFAHLSTDFPHALFFRVEAEEQPEISESYSVSAVPYFVFCKQILQADCEMGLKQPSNLNVNPPVKSPSQQMPCSENKDGNVRSSVGGHSRSSLLLRRSP